jgi:cytochrome c553
VKALQDYKSGSRKNTTMRAIAARLTDEDISDLAAYYSGSGAAK